jgi:hypothetical protein
MITKIYNNNLKLLNNYNFHIFIASCFEGLNIQVKRLIKNIVDIKTIPVEYVHFIVGGCPEEKIYYENDIEIVCVKFRCFEYTPLIYITLHKDKYNFDYAFFTHDTVIFGNNFYNVIKNDIKYLKNTNFQTMRINNLTLSMNIGIYCKDIILKNKDTLLKLSIISNDSNDLMRLKHKLCNYEDFLFINNYYREDDEVEYTSTKLVGINGKFTNGVIQNYKRIDFIKYKSNSGYVQSIDICKI